MDNSALTLCAFGAFIIIVVFVFMNKNLMRKIINTMWTVRTIAGIVAFLFIVVLIILRLMGKW